MESLVIWSVFDSIEVAFLPVGHTHEYIDQFFSIRCYCLRSENAITLAGFHNFLQTAFDGSAHVVHTKDIGNWSGLCYS